MPYDPEIHHRRSVRLVSHNYSDPGSYFVTICAFEKRCYFGSIENFEVRLSLVGTIINKCWHSIPTWFPSVTLDHFVIMPNHLHAILVLDQRDSNTKPPASLSTIVRSFKSACTRHFDQQAATEPKNIWQRNYHEHIIRSRRRLFELRQYILDNPTNWHLDELYTDSLR